MLDSEVAGLTREMTLEIAGRYCIGIEVLDTMIATIGGAPVAEDFAVEIGADG